MVTWGLAITTAAIGGFIGLARSTSAEDTLIRKEVTTADTAIIDRVSKVEARIERLPVIENKLDALLLRSGIKPETIK